MKTDKPKKRKKKLVWEVVDYSKGSNRPTRRESIRLKCMDCTCNNKKEVVACEIVSCPLWIWRLGREIKETKQKEKTVCEVVIQREEVVVNQQPEVQVQEEETKKGKEK